MDNGHHIVLKTGLMEFNKYIKCCIKMPFHIKTNSVMNPTIGDVYYKGDNSWTEIYADRKVYTNESDADAVKATTVTMNGVTYAPKHYSNSTVVSE
jgi:hypothetical protein